MTRTALAIPFVLLAVIGAGVGICRASHVDPHIQEMLIAAAVALVSAEAACVPAMLLKGADTATMSQAALGGTVLQMLLCLGMLAVTWLAGLNLKPQPMVWWLMSFYWTSLAALVIGMSITIRARARAAAPVSSARGNEQ